MLFLCTGNYYRSRFAEEFFNHYAHHYTLDWQADSLGLQRNFQGNGNVGPIAQNTLNKLESLGIAPRNADRMPDHVYAHHIEQCDRVIAVSLDEHKPMVDALWPRELASKVEYFDVEDLHIEGPETALPRLIHHLNNLIETLKT